MKRATTNHPKFRQLVKMLDVSTPTAVGLLELLWHRVEEFHDDGAIGQWSNDLIAGAAEWNGSADHFVRSLLATGFLDEVPAEQGDARLVIHDWLCHCASHVWDRVKKRVRRALAAGTGVPAWLAAAHDKACEERRRNGGGEADDDHQVGDPSDPRQRAAERGSRSRRAKTCNGATHTSETGQPGPAAPDVSGCVRLRPAASTPNPRPKTHDLFPSDRTSDMKKDGTAASSAAPTSPPPPGSEFLRFVCNGKPDAWSLTAEHLASLETAYPAVRVLDCLTELSRRMVHNTGLRRTARGMPRYVDSWLDLEVRRYRKFLKNPSSNGGLRVRNSQSPKPTAAERGEFAENGPGPIVVNL